MLYAKRALFLLFVVLPITTYFVGSHGSFSLNVSSLLRHFMNPPVSLARASFHKPRYFPVYDSFVCSVKETQDDKKSRKT